MVLPAQGDEHAPSVMDNVATLDQTSHGAEAEAEGLVVDYNSTTTVDEMGSGAGAGAEDLEGYSSSSSNTIGVDDSTGAGDLVDSS